MKSTDDAKVVHVYVDDLSLVIADDVHDWLKIIGEVDEVKTQYDTSRRTFFYWVRFRHSASAQQAVDYLDGERLKNCVVTIRSTVFRKRLESKDTDESTNPLVMEADEKTLLQPRNVNLPYNHLMPTHLQMDAVLVDCIPSLGDDVLAEGLRKLQESYCRAKDSIEAIHKNMEQTDVSIKMLLQGEKEAINTIKSDATELHSEKPLSPHVPRCIRNTVPIPHSLFDPVGIISKFTRCVGPVTGYSFSGSGGSDLFCAVVEFLNTLDRDLALRRLSEFNGVEEKLQKRGRFESLGETTKDDLRSLSCYKWCEDNSVSPFRCENLSVALTASHKEASSILSLLCKEKKQ